MDLFIQIIIGVVYAILIFFFGKLITRKLKNHTVRPKKLDAIKAFAIITAFVIIIKKLAEGIIILLNKNNYSIDLFDNDSIVVYIILSLPIYFFIYLSIKNNAKMTYHVLTEWLTAWGILILVLLFILCFGIWAFTDKL